MSPYREMLAARFQALLQYRVAALAGLGTQVFWGLLRAMVFTAFYASSTVAQPMTLSEVVTYVWLGQGSLMLVLWRVDPEIQSMVDSGNVAYELLRPVDLYAMWFARSVANRAAPTLLRILPLYLLAIPLFGMGLPASPAAAAAWLLSLFIALILSAAIGTLLMISLLWTVSGRGLSIWMTTGAWTLSGIALPLPLFPTWAQPVVEALPFRALMDTPFRLYLGHIPAAEILPVLAHQLAWIAVIVVFGRWLLARGSRRLVVQGG